MLTLCSDNNSMLTLKNIQPHFIWVSEFTGIFSKILWSLLGYLNDWLTTFDLWIGLKEHWLAYLFLDNVL